jgi:hypothetical protein
VFYGDYIITIHGGLSKYMTTKPKIFDYFILVYKPGHPRAVSAGYVPEHYLLAEKVLKRGLTPDEDVRHINGNAHDNRIENLEIVSTNADYRTQALGIDSAIDRQPRRSYVPCKFQRICWKEIRAPIARREKVYLPYLCSFQVEGDIYKCSHFWGYVDKDLEGTKSLTKGADEKIE